MTRRIKKHIKRCLNKVCFLPYESWRKFSIQHDIKNEVQVPRLKDDFERNKIKESVRHKSGIYIYKKGSKVIYIGKAKKLRSRLNAHYTESYKKPSSKSNAKRWYDFFSKHRGKLTIYWKEVTNEKERRVLEQMLTFILDPEFDREKK